MPGVCSEPERTKRLRGKFHLCQFSTAPSPVLAKKALESCEPRPASWELHQGPPPVVVAPRYLLCCVAVSCPGGKGCVWLQGSETVCLWSRLYKHIHTDLPIHTSVCKIL